MNKRSVQTNGTFKQDYKTCKANCFSQNKHIKTNNKDYKQENSYLPKFTWTEPGSLHK